MNVIFLAKHGFFTQDNIQNFISCLDISIIELNCFLKGGYFVFRELAFNSVEYMSQIMALHIDHIHVGLNGFKLCHVLLPKLLEDHNLLVLFVLGQNI